MRRIFYLFLIASVLFACNSSKYFLSQRDVDNALFEAVDALTEKPTHASATKALPILYANAQKKHLGEIEALNKTKGIDRWNKILSTYEILQELNDAITNSAPAAKLVKPVDYQPEIEQARQRAAEESYQLADNLFKTGKKSDAFKAYEYFKMAIGFVPDYKDGGQKMEAAFNNGTLHVLVKPFKHAGSQEDYTINFIDVHGGTQKNRSSLLADLESQVSTEFPIKFYTYTMDTTGNRGPDCIIDVRLNYFNMGQPISSASSYQRTEQLIEGYDTSRNPIYTTVVANVTTWRTSLSADMSVNVDISETGNIPKVTSKTFKEDYTWKSEFADYRGDDRAITNNESRMAAGLGNTTAFPANGQTALMQLYKRLYPRLMTHIRSVLKEQLKNKGFLSQ